MLYPHHGEVDELDMALQLYPLPIYGGIELHGTAARQPPHPTHDPDATYITEKKPKGLKPMRSWIYTDQGGESHIDRPDYLEA